MAYFRLQGLQKITPTVFHDERGCFLESYRKDLAIVAGIHFVQDNTVVSKQGVVRGLHFQQNPGQTKLVYCSFGTIWDVAVDIRPESSTFGQWEAVYLDGKTWQQFLIPVGFAHGYCVLSETAIVHYKVSSFYDPKQEKSIRWNDSDLNIPWPITNAIVSDRDQKSPYFKEVFQCTSG